MSKIHFKGFTIRTISSHGNKRYQLDMSLGGERVRRKFKSLQEAKDEATRQSILQGHIGQKAFELDEDSRADALLAKELLNDYGASLQDVAKFYVRHQAAKKGRGIEELIDEYIEYHHKRVNSSDETDTIREKTFTDLKQRISFWSIFNKRSPDSISDKEIRLAVKSKSLSGISQRNYIRHLSLFYNWCIDRGYASSNPAIKVQIKVRRKDPDIYEPEEVVKILDVAEKLHPEIIPYFVLAFFAGIRPDEITRMDWKDIKWNRNAIQISSSASKTNSSRTFPIKSNLLSWLNAYKTDGKIFPFSESSLKRWRAEIYKTAGVRTIQDGARHSFATFSYALDGLEKTIDALGHSTSDMLLKHYKNQITGREKQAEIYFNISYS